VTKITEVWPQKQRMC